MKSVVEDIKKGSFKPVYLFYGEEAYLKQQYKNRLKDAVLPEGDTINLSIYSGKGIDVEEMIAQADTMPFFAEHRLLLIEDSGFFKNANQQLADYIPSIPEGTIMLFVESEVDKRGKLYKAVNKKGSVVEFTAQNEQTLTRWILGILKSEKKNDHFRCDETVSGKNGDGYGADTPGTGKTDLLLYGERIHYRRRCRSDLQ